MEKAGLGSEAVTGGLVAPADLYGKEFKHAVFGGYEAKEVDAFLESVGETLKTLYAQVLELKTTQEEYRKRLNEYREIEAILRNALVTSQKMAEETMAAAKKEAELMVEGARVERDRLQVESAKLPAALALEIKRLQEQRDRLRADLAGVLTSHRTMLENVAPAEKELGAYVFIGMHEEVPGTEVASFRPATDAELVDANDEPSSEPTP